MNTTMNTIRWSVWAILFFISSPQAFAAVFDSADILPRNAAAAGGFGELLLSDPISEGVEAHGRFGVSEELNVAGIIGTGSKSKRLRLGGEMVYSFIPDVNGQVGLSALTSMLYLKRETGGGLQLRLSPLAHKRFTGWNGYPASIYLAFPLYLEARNGSYFTATQLVAGSIMDVSSDSVYYLVPEAGIRVAKAESYILLGFGIRFGELKVRQKGKEEKGSKNKKEDEEFRSEDFEQP